jgi:hypothetical protein
VGGGRAAMGFGDGGGAETFCPRVLYVDGGGLVGGRVAAGWGEA